MIDQINQGLICPYCFNATKYVDSSVIYGRSYGMVYMCKPCDAWVGVHKSDNKVALGRLADAELREYKKLAHAAFDPLWKLQIFTRSGAYTWLADQMGISKDLCHVGMFDVEKCKLLIEICNDYFNNTPST